MDDKTSRTAIAGEYNGGVLLFLSTQDFSEGVGATVSDALAEVGNSVTYDSFEPQTTYSYYPGKYIMTMQDAPRRPGYIF